MIFVTVGTNEARFDRMLAAVASLDLDEPMLVQHGHSAPIGSAGAELVPFLSFDAVADAIRRARVVVTHAGVGTTVVSLANGKRPIVVPRRKAYGEAVDDHQLQIGRRFAQAGLVTLVDSLDDLAAAVAADQIATVVRPTAAALAEDIRRYLDESIGAARGAA